MEEESKIILYTTPDGKSRVSLMSRDGHVWLNQKQMAELFAVSKMNISLHVSNILKEKELGDSVVKCYFTTAADGKKYKVIYYALEMILAVGFRVRGVRGTQFRQWANANLSEYLVKGFTMDDERLKNPDGRPDYFDELLARIRDIRASEKRFYQKVRDLLALSSDYRGNELAANRFFAEVQNKLLFAATGHTAAELVVGRSDPSKPNMGLTYCPVPDMLAMRRPLRCRTSGMMRLMSGGSKRRLALLTRPIWQSFEGLRRRLKNVDELVAEER